jgi:peptidoglycan/xylan/chitin deacetylase (PgdA/CDA1 family)
MTGRTLSRSSVVAVATAVLVAVALVATGPLAAAEPAMPSWGGRYTGKLMRGVVTTQKVVALTIDDGPTAATKQVVDILDSYGAKGTFFMIKNRYRGDPSWVLSASQHGDEIGNHGATHTPLQGRTPEILHAQITDDDDWIAQLTGREPLWVRPSGGFIDAGGKAAVADTGHLVALWSIDSDDSHGGAVNYTSDAVFKHATTDVRSGSIILMHQTHPWSLAALPRVCAWLRDNGYRMVTLDELAAAGSPGTPTGPAISSTAEDLKKYPVGLGLGPVKYVPAPASATETQPPAETPAATPASAASPATKGASASTAAKTSTGPLSGLPAWVLWVAGVLLALQLLVQVACLYGIWTVRAESLRSGRKWPWVLVVVLTGLLGCAAYLLAARRPRPRRRAAR